MSNKEKSNDDKTEPKTNANEQPPAKNDEPKNDVPPAKKKPTEYVVAIGALIVGKGEKRELGATVKGSELPPAQLEYFVADGTLKPK